MFDLYDYLSDDESSSDFQPDEDVSASMLLQGGDAVQTDYDNVMLFASRWKGWNLIAVPPMVGSTARAKRSIAQLHNLWRDQDAKRKDATKEVSEFSNQWKAVLLKYNQKLSKIEEEKSASQSISDLPPFLPQYIDLRGLHSEYQILLGIWRQLNLSSPQNLSNLHDIILGYLSQASKVSLIIFDHVSALAASILPKLFDSISDIIGMVVIGEMLLDMPSNLADQSDNSFAILEDAFVQEVSRWARLLNLPWELATEKENERVMVNSMTLTSRATNGLISNLLGYAPESILSNNTSPKINSDSAFRLSTNDQRKSFSTLSLEQQTVVKESIEIIAELSEGIPGLVAILVNIELPILKRLLRNKSSNTPTRSRLLSTSKFVNAGRVFATVQKLILAVFDTIMVVEKDRRDLFSLLYFLCPLAIEQVNFTIQSHTTPLSSLVCQEDIIALGISDAYLQSLVSKGFLVSLSSSTSLFSMPLIISQLLLTHKSALTSKDDRFHMKSFVFRQHCANLATEFRNIIEQDWVNAVRDLQVVPACTLQKQILISKLESILPQINMVIQTTTMTTRENYPPSLSNSEVSEIPLASEDLLQSLFLLLGGGGSILVDWVSIDVRINMLQGLSRLLRTLSGEDIKKSLGSILSVLGSGPCISLHILLLQTMRTIQKSLFEWWWLMGADVFTSKNSSSRLRQEKAIQTKRIAVEAVGLLDRLLAVSSQLLTDIEPSQDKTRTSLRSTSSVFFQNQHLLISFQHKWFSEYAMSLDVLDSLDLVKVKALVDEYAIQLRGLSTQAVASLDGIDFSDIDMSEVVDQDNDIEAILKGIDHQQANSSSQLLDRIPGTQKLLLSVKKTLKGRYEHIMDRISLSGMSSPESRSFPNSPSRTLSPKKQQLQQRLKRESFVKSSKNMRILQLSTDDVEKIMLLQIANGFPFLYEIVSGLLLQLMVRRYHNSHMKATAIAHTSVEGFLAPSTSSDLVYRGRLLFSLSLMRHFGSTSIVHPSTFYCTGNVLSGEPLGGGPVCDTEEDTLLWSAYLQRVADEQEGLSPTPWQTIISSMYSHPIICEAERESMSFMRHLLRQIAVYMRTAHQEYEKLFEAVDFSFSAEKEEEEREEVKSPNNQKESSLWNDRLSLSNISSLSVANAGLLYADIVTCLSQFGEFAIVSDKLEEASNASEEIMFARDVCEDSLQIWSRIMAQYNLRDYLPRLITGFSYYLMYNLSVLLLTRDIAMYTSSSSKVTAERYLGSVYHKSIASMTAAEAIARLEQRKNEAQQWNIAFHYQHMAFRLLQAVNLPRLYRSCVTFVGMCGLNDYYNYYRYQMEIQRVLEPERGGTGNNTANITSLQLPEELLDTIHMMTKALQQLIQYDYHQTRRLLDRDLLSYFALATTNKSSSNVDLDNKLTMLTKDIVLTQEEMQQQRYIYTLQSRLQYVSGQQLLLLYTARVYDSLIGAQSVSVPPLISTNISLPFLHPQQSISQNHSRGTYEVSSTGFTRAMDLYKHIMAQYRELSNLLYAEELWTKDDDVLKKSKKSPKKKKKKKVSESFTLWGQIVESVFPHPYDSFFQNSQVKSPKPSSKTASQSHVRPQRKIVGGKASSTSASQLMTSALMTTPDRAGKTPNINAVSPISPITPATPMDFPQISGAMNATDIPETPDNDVADEEVKHIDDEDALFINARHILRLREYYSSLALRYADALYLLGEAVYHDGLAKYKVSPQLSDEISDLVFQQHVAAVSAARQLYEQELTPRQYCPISLIISRHVAQHQLLQNKLDDAIKSFEDLLKIFLDTKFTSLLVLAEIYTEYGDALMLKKEYFHASLMYQMAIDQYRDYDSERPDPVDNLSQDNTKRNKLPSMTEEDTAGPQSLVKRKQKNANEHLVEATNHTQTDAERYSLPANSSPLRREGLLPQGNSSFSLDSVSSLLQEEEETGGSEGNSHRSPKKKHQAHNTRSALLLDYAWSPFVPVHLQDANVTEEFLKARIAMNLLAKGKAIFATEDYEQAQELAEQTQQIFTFLMPSLPKVIDEEAVKQEKREAKLLPTNQDNTNATRDNHDAEANHSDNKPPAVLRAEREALEAQTQERELRRSIVCSSLAVETYILLALIHFQFDELDEAERYFHKAETAVYEMEEEESLTMIKIFHNRGILLHSKEEKEDAKLFFEQALMLLFRRHSNAFYQISSTLDALEEVCDELKLTEDLKRVETYRDELDQRVFTLERAKEERKQDLQRLVSGLMDIDRERAQQRQRWNEEEAAVQGFDDDGNVHSTDDEAETEATREEMKRLKRRFRQLTSNGPTRGHRPRVESDDVSSSSDTDLAAGHNSVSSSDDDDDEEEEESETAFDHFLVDEHVDVSSVSEATKRKWRRKLQKRLRHAATQRRNARRQRREATAAALLRRHRHTLSSASSLASPKLKPFSSQGNLVSHATTQVAAGGGFGGVPATSWQEYALQKRLHVVAGVGVDRLTVGMLRRAFRELQSEAAVARHKSQITSQVPTVVYAPADASSRSVDWQEKVRHQQHAIFFGVAEEESELDDEEGQTAAAVRSVDIDADHSNHRHRQNQQPASKLTHKKKDTTHSEHTSGDKQQPQKTQKEEAQDTHEEDELPELPSGNCVVS